MDIIGLIPCHQYHNGAGKTMQAQDMSPITMDLDFKFWEFNKLQVVIVDEAARTKIA
jgi:hypothetical protein